MRGAKTIVFGIVAVATFAFLVSCPDIPHNPPPSYPEVEVWANGIQLQVGDTIRCGSTSVGAFKDVSIRIDNTGDAALELAGSPIVRLSGTDAAFFSVPEPPAASVDAGKSTSFTLRFSPDAVRDYQATLGFDTNDADEETFLLALQAEGTPTPEPEINILNPHGAAIADGSGSYAFDGTLVGATSDATFTIQNLGTADLTLGGTPKVLITGGDSALFSVAGPDPSSPVLPGGSTQFTLRFAPTSPGAKSTSIIVFSTDADEMCFDFTVSGLGQAPEIEIKQGSTVIPCGSGSYAFTTATVGAAVDVDFSILNHGNAPLHLTGATRVVISGTDASQFAVTIAPETPVAVSPGRSDFRVRFAPTSGGPKSAEVSIENDDADENPYTFGIGGQATESPPPTPANFRVVSVTANSILLGWDPAAGAASYHLQQSADGSTGWADAPSGAAIAGTSYTHGGLTTGVTVYYRVAAVNSGGASGWSVVVSGTTATVVAPAPPTLVTPVGAVDPVSLQWLAPTTWGTGIGPCTYTLMIDDAIWVTGLSSTVTSYSLIALSVGSHSWRVVASNGSLATTSATRSFFLTH